MCWTPVFLQSNITLAINNVCNRMRDSEEKGNDKGNEWRKQAIKINLGGRGWNGSSRMKKKRVDFSKKNTKTKTPFQGSRERCRQRWAGEIDRISFEISFFTTIVAATFSFGYFEGSQAGKETPEQAWGLGHLAPHETAGKERIINSTGEFYHNCRKKCPREH